MIIDTATEVYEICKTNNRKKHTAWWNKEIEELKNKKNE